MLVAISTAIPLLVAGVLIVWMAARSASGTLARNSWVGIRTAATLRGDDEWRTGHAAAVVPMYAGGSASPPRRPRRPRRCSWARTARCGQR